MNASSLQSSERTRLASLIVLLVLVSVFAVACQADTPRGRLTNTRALAQPHALNALATPEPAAPFDDTPITPAESVGAYADE